MIFLGVNSTLTVISSAIIFLVLTLLLVIILLLARHYLVATGKVKISINNGKKEIEIESGKSLLNSLHEGGVMLSSACGGKGSCGQCKIQVLEGGGDILPTETVHFSRKEQQDHWRLGCQVKVKDNMKVQVPDSVLEVKEYECTVVSNKLVSSFIKEFIVALPEGEHMDFIPGSYAQIKIPTYEMDYNVDIDKESLGDYLPTWEKYDMFSLKCKNTEETVRAYSMANYPAEGDRFMLTVRIATPPFKPKPQTGFMDVSPGIASSYIFTLKPGDKVIMSGPYGDFHPIFDSKKEMIWVGGGAGMAPLRAQIMHMTKTLHTRDREMHYFYGARSLSEVFYLEDFLEIEKEYPNFHFHLALDRPDPVADEAGVKYTAGFIAPVMYETYLKNHEAPEDCEYYMCGPAMMSKTVNEVLDKCGVDPSSIHYDNFG
ncbi:MAG: NADH:ubiquinone reductase (Na(+)-transporting) subunit F [Muribaculaceae bacterium]|nr:NADH:ubiquinone reductase (Na(+)-transporting) subunit F [Muribaculaceae bacterium]MBQ6278494.1 NADH:ubiquinone reductase (Na(+)-transporting) subunit F [Muribaculaceae bacterium]MBR0025185.1 NADH:ubiquinone reductase (Na(+)-transporting) subunit F [Muribaculaceae bacterium]